MRSLSETFNVNYFLVSQTNPHIVPLMNLKKRVNRKLGNFVETEWKHRCHCVPLPACCQLMPAVHELRLLAASGSPCACASYSSRVAADSTDGPACRFAQCKDSPAQTVVHAQVSAADGHLAQLPVAQGAEPAVGGRRDHGAAQQLHADRQGHHQPQPGGPQGRLPPGAPPSPCLGFRV